MIMERLMGLCAVVPATLLLTVSFFVLVVIQRIEKAGLKAFGYVVAALLWLGVALVGSLGIYTLATGRPPMMCMMRAKMCEMMVSGMMGVKEGMMKPGPMEKMPAAQK
ncbi:MAG: hypothetical protein FJZ09_02290 [Candidatus Omnitrophica bacterium]|nr:hypothetical protein [Candidatus Omnitrophota bacterium]